MYKEWAKVHSFLIIYTQLLNLEFACILIVLYCTNICTGNHVLVSRVELVIREL